MQSADFLSAVFFYLKVGENLNQNWIVENLNNAFPHGMESWASYGGW